MCFGRKAASFCKSGNLYRRPVGEAFFEADAVGPVVNRFRPGQSVELALYSIISEMQAQILTSELLHICEQLLRGMHVAHIQREERDGGYQREHEASRAEERRVG